jgi:hypothetical protein
MKLPWINNNTPGTYILFLAVKNRHEKFICVCFSHYPIVTIKSLSSFGYQVKEIDRFKFADEKSAIKELQRIAINCKNHEYSPDRDIKEKGYCYKTNLMYVTYLHDDPEIVNGNDIESQVCMMLNQGLKGREIAKKLDLKDYQVTRIKQKNGL